MECVGGTVDSLPSFPFKNNVSSEYVYIIQIDRDILKDRLDAGNFELFLAPLSGSSNQLINTGSNVQINKTSTTLFSLIDDSDDSKQLVTDDRDVNDFYYIVSGSKQKKNEGVRCKREKSSPSEIFMESFCRTFERNIRRSN